MPFIIFDTPEDRRKGLCILIKAEEDFMGYSSGIFHVTSNHIQEFIRLNIMFKEVEDPTIKIIKDYEKRKEEGSVKEFVVIPKDND